MGFRGLYKSVEFSFFLTFIMIKTYGGGKWIYDSKEVSFEDAELVVMPGGSDWGTEYYNHDPIPGVPRHNSDLNQRQYDLAKRAIVEGKFVWGNCKGLQLVTILAGGWLIQDVNHPSYHEMVLNNGKTYRVNSLHHQMCYPYDLPDNHYEVIGWSRQLSKYHTIQGNKQLSFNKKTLDKDGLFKEPELIWYPTIKSFGGQFHAEWMDRNATLDLVNDIIREKMNK